MRTALSTKNWGVPIRMLSMMANNSAWVSVGTDHDTTSLLYQRFNVGGAPWARAYPKAKELMIMADGGAATDRACPLGGLSCNASPMKRISLS